MADSLSELSQLTPGAHPLRREVVVRHQLERILTAVVELVAARGYRNVSVAAIVKQAGTSRLKFYENFSSKEDCFLAAFDAGIEAASGRVAQACEAAGSELPARVGAGIDALLGFLAERPALARACALQAPSLGAAMGDRRARAIASFAPLLDGARESATVSELPAGVEESVLDGLYWLLYDALLSGSPEPVAELRGALVEFALLPFLGPASARQAGAL
ncbi:MAG: TetR/AcrR family transcriptional regulator [Solirubrobacterales bacterium]|nr:TetR/AcrR family transcriptional regulator [Solirubrobacterales bacterium]